MKKELFIIDDDQVYRMIVKMMIGYFDSSLKINECENGEIGLAWLESINNSDHKIIVLLDINMPVLDGWGFLEKIEKCNFYNLNPIEIYLVSSSTDKSDIVKSKNYKFLKGFLHKPLSSEVLETIIGK